MPRNSGRRFNAETLRAQRKEGKKEKSKSYTESAENTEGTESKGRAKRNEDTHGIHVQDTTFEVDIEERFLSAQTDRFTLTRASRNESEKQRRRFAPFEMTGVVYTKGHLDFFSSSM